MRVGVGYDAHRFAAGRRLVLGGVEIPHPLGLFGHSDADVVTHAVIDAVLGAAGLADIGVLFPDTDPEYRGAASVKLLAEVTRQVREWGWRVGNVDVVVVLEEPRLAEHRQRMREGLAAALETGVENVWVKAKTTEGMGFEGRREGVSATAVCLLTPE
jgi:2-C-methyl-D-erythritol 2,4-cyclodiphosphate synthase